MTMRVLYVQNPHNMTDFFSRYKGKIIQKGKGGIRNFNRNANDYVVSTGKSAKIMMSNPKNQNVTLVDPNVKTVNQAKEEMNRDEQIIIPVKTGIKRKSQTQSTSEYKRPCLSDDKQKKAPAKKPKTKPKKKPVTKTALSI